MDESPLIEGHQHSSSADKAFAGGDETGNGEPRVPAHPCAYRACDGFGVARRLLPGRITGAGAAGEALASG